MIPRGPPWEAGSPEQAAPLECAAAPRLGTVWLGSFLGVWASPPNLADRSRDPVLAFKLDLIGPPASLLLLIQQMKAVSRFTLSRRQILEI